jgi:hypothetical protein
MIAQITTRPATRHAQRKAKKITKSRPISAIEYFSWAVLILGNGRLPDLEG